MITITRTEATTLSRLVLCVDEEPELRSYLARILFPHLMVFTSTFASGLNIIRKSAISLVLVNDRRDPRQLTDFLARLDETYRPPLVLALLGRQVISEQSCLRAGVYRCFNKRFLMRELADTILEEMFQVTHDRPYEDNWKNCHGRHGMEEPGDSFFEEIFPIAIAPV